MYRRQKKVFETDSGKGWVILGCSTTEDDKCAIGEIPEKSGVIRVDDFIQGLAITSNGKGGTKGGKIEKLFCAYVVSLFYMIFPPFQLLCIIMTIRKGAYRLCLLTGLHVQAFQTFSVKWRPLAINIKNTKLPNSFILNFVDLF